MRRPTLTTWLAICVTVRLTLLLILMRGGVDFFSADDASRYSLASSWVRSPYWFPDWDGIWLTGGTIYFGTWIKLLGNGIGVTLGCVVASLGVILAAAFSALQLTRSRAAAMLAAGAVTIFHGSVWFSLGPLSENLQAAAYLIMLGAGARFIRRPDWSTAGMCSLAAFVTASMHYVCWIAIAATCPVLVIALLLECRKSGASFKALAPQLALIGAGCVGFLLLWMMGSWHYLGHPLQFLYNQHDLMARYMGTLHREGSGLAGMAVYPRVLVRMLWPALIALPLALPLRAGAAKRGVWLGIASSGVMLALMMLTTLGGGYGVPERSLMVLAVLLLVLAAAGAALWLEEGAGMARRWRGLVLLALAGTFGWQQHGQSVELERRNLTTVDHNLIALGHWLRHEFTEAQAVQGWNEKSHAHVTLLATHPDNFMAVAMLSNRPEQFAAPAVGRPGAFGAGDIWICEGEPPPGGYVKLRNFGLFYVLQAMPQVASLPAK